MAKGSRHCGWSSRIIRYEAEAAKRLSAQGRLRAAARVNKIYYKDERCSANRNESATSVKVGLIAPPVGKTLDPAM